MGCLTLATNHFRTDYNYAVEYHSRHKKYMISDMDTCIKDRIAGNACGWVIVEMFYDRESAVDYVLKQ